MAYVKNILQIMVNHEPETTKEKSQKKAGKALYF
jgi:hypothetical protein